MNIKNMDYVDISDLSEESQKAYGDFVCDLGVGNGSPWEWIINESEKDSVPMSYIGKEKCKIIDEDLKKLGLKDGDEINIVKNW